jgi:hypothetical protein
LDTSQKFGANEAKFSLVTKPEVTLTIDSSKGFEDIVTISNAGNININNAIIVLETQGFTYFCYGFTKEPLQLLVRAIPSSRILAISYATNITKLGE